MIIFLSIKYQKYLGNFLSKITLNFGIFTFTRNHKVFLIKIKYGNLLSSCVTTVQPSFQCLICEDPAQTTGSIKTIIDLSVREYLLLSSIQFQFFRQNPVMINPK